jgi:Skp family chaperone for outer membrane proteins
VKRKFAFALGAAALGTAVVLTNYLWAQGPGGQAGLAQPPTKVATLNIAAVTKGYKKFDLFVKEMQDLERPFTDQAKTIAERYKQWEDALRGATTDQKRDEAQKNLVTLKRMMEDNQAAAVKAVGARRNEKLVQLFQEIQDAAGRYAKSNGIMVVLQYYEPLNSTEIFTPVNIDRKLKSSGAGAYTPLYIADGVDISQQVVNILNGPFEAASAAPGGGGTH